ncbi:MAG: nuclear transport factor 2 family protein [Actinomycetota bacterium]|nr:nuclear transport factor 2 family protein [Actinomycetota bacterium]
MSHENIELVRRVYNAVAAGDAEAVLALYDPEAEFDFSRSPFGSVTSQTVYRGHEGLRCFFRERYEVWQEVEDGYEELIDAGDHVISAVTSRGRGRGSGVEVERTHYGVWSIDAGKVVRVEWFGTRAEALEAAGLRE